jgi:hypothetical protein
MVILERLYRAQSDEDRDTDNSDYEYLKDVVYRISRDGDIGCNIENSVPYADISKEFNWEEEEEDLEVKTSRSLAEVLPNFPESFVSK